MPDFWPSDLEALRSLAEAAGRAVLGVYRRDYQQWEKADQSPLTEADLLSDDILRRGLARAFPDVPIVSEESAPEIPAGAPSFFLVDPLDGTREFLQRNDEFTVNIAWIAHGVPVAGVVIAPALGQSYWGAAGHGAFRQSQDVTQSLPVPTSGQPTDALRVLVTRSHDVGGIDEWLARMGAPCTLVRAGSSLKFCRLAEGAADLYPRFGPTAQWDTAAGQAVLEAAGGVVLDESGQPLRYGAHRPVLNGRFLAKRDPALAAPLP